MKKRAVGYIRVSTQAQAKEGESLKTQEKQISDFIKNKKGWESVKIYSDKARSGSTDVGRSQFQQMIQRAKKGEFQGIVFSRLSRFARNAGDFLHHRDMLRESGVELFSVKENIDPTTPSGKLMMGLMAIIAEWEREMMAEQMGENKMALWREGKINMGQPPLGYDWDRKERELVIVPEEKEIYLKMVDLYLNQGLPMKDITLKLTEEGVRGKRGGSLTSKGIGDIFKNTTYYGHRVQNQYEYEYNPGWNIQKRMTRPCKNSLGMKNQD
jgi:site-specific DNA recombinase